VFFLERIAFISTSACILYLCVSVNSVSDDYYFVVTRSKGLLGNSYAFSVG